MNLVRWEPFREMEDFLRQFAPALASGLARSSGGPTVWRPAADISESDKEYLIKAELPGVNKEDVKIALQDGILTLSGERKLEAERSDDNQIRVERFYGAFTRSFVLPENVDTSNVRAEAKDGVLLVHIPKKTPSKAKPIAIEVN